MPKLIYLYDGDLKNKTQFPPIEGAVRVIEVAKKKGCDVIRIERMNGALVNEFTITQVENYIKQRKLIVQKDQFAQQGKDWEKRAGPFFPGVKFASPPKVDPAASYIRERLAAFINN